MNFILIYLIIGSVLTIMASEIDNLPSYDSEDIKITNSDKVVFILFWPAILIYTFYKLKK